MCRFLFCTAATYFIFFCLLLHICLFATAGSSERNISAVILQKDSSKALRAVHSEFHLSVPIVSVVVVVDEKEEESGKRPMEELKVKSAASRIAIDTAVAPAAVATAAVATAAVSSAAIAQECIQHLLKCTDVHYDIVGNVRGNLFTASKNTAATGTNATMPLAAMAEWLVEHVDNPMVIDCTQGATSPSSKHVAAWVASGTLKVITSNVHHRSLVDQQQQYRTSHFNASAAVGNMLPVERLIASYLRCHATVLHIHTVFGTEDLHVAKAQMVALGKAVGVVVKNGVVVQGGGGDGGGWRGEINVKKQSIVLIAEKNAIQIEKKTEETRGQPRKDKEKLQNVFKLFLDRLATPVVLSGPCDTSTSIGLALCVGACSLSPAGRSVASITCGSPRAKRSSGSNVPTLSLNFST